MKRVCFYLFSALLIIFISSCSSTRSMKKGVSIGNLSESEYMEELISRSPGWRRRDGREDGEHDGHERVAAASFAVFAAEYQLPI